MISRRYRPLDWYLSHMAGVQMVLMERILVRKETVNERRHLYGCECVFVGEREREK